MVEKVSHEHASLNWDFNAFGNKIALYTCMLQIQPRLSEPG